MKTISCHNHIGLMIFIIFGALILLGFQGISAAAAPSTPKKALLEADKCRKTLYLSKERMKLRDQWLPCIEHYETIPSRFSKSDEAAWALYWEAKMYRDLYIVSRLPDDLATAIKLLEQLSQEYPDHRMADDAQYLIGQIYYEDKNDPSKAYVEFLKVDIHFPNGDMRPKAQIMMDKLSGLIAQKTESFPQEEKKIAVAAPQNTTTALLTGIRYWSTPTYTRVVIDLDKPVKFKSRLLKEDVKHKLPRRLYLDLQEAFVTGDIDSNIPIKDDLLQAARAGQYSRDVVRVVLDINNIGNYKIFPLHDPFRIVIDVKGAEKSDLIKKTPKNKEDKTAKTANAAKDKSLGKGRKKADGPDKAITLAQQLGLNVKKIIIDPGHGGKDPGCFYNGNLLEKDLTLNLAQLLAKKLEEKANCKVELTRNKDIFLPLDERTAFVNTQKADLFISLHINAHKQSAIHGIETYFLNMATDESAMMAAARENATSEKNISDLQTILKDLMLNTNIHESSKLAYAVQKGMIDTLSPKFNPVKDLGVKQAPFYVLIGAEMPACLVEAGFITNTTERSHLQNKEYLDQIAEGILSGIKQYIGIGQASQTGG